MKKTTREKRIWPLSPWTYDKKYFLTRVVECKKKTPGKNRLLALAPKGTDLADGGDRPGRRRIFARCLLHVFKTMY